MHIKLKTSFVLKPTCSCNFRYKYIYATQNLENVYLWGGGGGGTGSDISELKTVDHSPSVNLDEDTPK